MAKTTLLPILFYFCFLQCLSVIGAANAHLVPALYVFGDSLVDAGNNFYLPGATVKPVHKPYGIDFPNGTIGRFTNGFTMADYLAKSLGLLIPLPILDPRSRATYSTEGFNYASSSAGFLPDTGARLGANLCLESQVQLFRKTVQEFLPSRLKNQDAIKRHLQNSIYLIVIGSNDYSINYFEPKSSNWSRDYKPERFAELLVDKLGHQVQELYKLGAWKFVINEVGRLGCTPAVLKLANTTKCVEALNAPASIYNTKLARKITQLGKILKGAKFVTMKAGLSADLIENPSHYGFKNAINSCCTVAKMITCAPNILPCQNRRSYVFWDEVHPTDATNKLLAKACFKGHGACTPINVRELARL